MNGDSPEVEATLEDLADVADEYLGEPWSVHIMGWRTGNFTATFFKTVLEGMEVPGDTEMDIQKARKYHPEDAEGVGFREILYYNSSDPGTIRHALVSKSQPPLSEDDFEAINEIDFDAEFFEEQSCILDGKYIYTHEFIEDIDLSYESAEWIEDRDENHGNQNH